MFKNYRPERVTHHPRILDIIVQESGKRILLNSPFDKEKKISKNTRNSYVKHLVHPEELLAFQKQIEEQMKIKASSVK